VLHDGTNRHASALLPNYRYHPKNHTDIASSAQPEADHSRLQATGGSSCNRLRKLFACSAPGGDGSFFAPVACYSPAGGFFLMARDVFDGDIHTSGLSAEG